MLVSDAKVFRGESFADSVVEWQSIAGPAQPFLRDVAALLERQVEAFDPEIAAYTRYALGNQGKQLRPVLVALSAEAAGHSTRDHVTVAVVIEMVHLATLVHDDIMDEATLRRKRLTLAANWGNEISVLVGDCLFAHALTLAASFPTPHICRAVAAATNTVCGGEILQTHRRLNFEMTREEYFKVISMKTAELFALSTDLAAFLSGSGTDERKALKDYGRVLGTAYQIYDDCVDVFGTELSAGKSLGTDLASGKMTLPLLVVLEKATDDECEKLKELISGWRPHYLDRVLELMRRYDALKDSQRVIWDLLRKADEQLQEIPAGRGRQALKDLVSFLGRQTLELRVG